MSVAHNGRVAMQRSRRKRRAAELTRWAGLQITPSPERTLMTKRVKLKLTPDQETLVRHVRRALQTQGRPERGLPQARVQAGDAAPPPVQGVLEETRSTSDRRHGDVRHGHLTAVRELAPVWHHSPSKRLLPAARGRTDRKARTRTGRINAIPSTYVPPRQAACMSRRKSGRDETAYSCRRSRSR